MYRELTPIEAKKILDDNANAKLIDVREEYEYKTVAIPGAQLIPLGELPQSLDKLSKDDEIILQCHHGGRSAQACMFLLQEGFTNVSNLEGGIDAWAQEIDPSLPRY